MVRPDAGRSSEPLRRLFKHSIVRVQQMKSWCSSGALDLHAVSTRKKAAFVEHIVGRPSLARWSLIQGTPTRGATGYSRERDDGLRRVVVSAGRDRRRWYDLSIRRSRQSRGSARVAWRLWTRPPAGERLSCRSIAARGSDGGHEGDGIGGDDRFDGHQTDCLSTHKVPSRLWVFAETHTPKTQSREGTAPASARTVLS